MVLLALVGGGVGTAVSLSPPQAAACGPFYPATIVDQPDRALRDAPSAHFESELRRITPTIRVPWRAVLPEGGDYAGQTIAAERDELGAALKAKGLQQDEVQRTVAAYAAARRQLREFVAALREHQYRHRYDVANRPATPVLELPELSGDVPEEFSLYLNGAAAWHRGEVNAARRAWRALLDLPEDERRYRSAWAAYMLGRSYESGDTSQVISWMRRTRELVYDGCHDAVGLKVASLGWEALAELDRGNIGRAIQLYLVQYHCGDYSAVASLRLAVSRLLRHGSDAQQSEAAKHPDVRNVVNAYFVSRHIPGSLGAYRFAGTRVDAWLAAVEKANVDDAFLAEHIAWAAYRIGDYKRAARWLELADGDLLIVKWLQAKLLLRDGEIDKALPLLAAVMQRAAEEREAERAWRAQPDAGLGPPPVEDAGLFQSVKHAVSGEVAVLRLARREYTQAMELLIRNDWWWDGAYVAERVLTIDELKKHIDEHWPASTVAYSKDGHYVHSRVRGNAAETQAVSGRLRYLLARRLAREGRWDEARPYFSPHWRKVLDLYVQSLQQGRDTSRTSPDRALSLWRAAWLARHRGMELMGSEMEPDWTLLAGRFAPQSITARRTAGEGPDALVSQDERRRVQQAPTTPNKRFHYRYTASEHAWAAAMLLPDDDPRTARILWEAGCWLIPRDDKAADRFYKAMVRRNEQLPAGRYADRIRWFPKPHTDHIRELKGNTPELDIDLAALLASGDHGS